ncbi:MAG TPA: hypothetical protein VFO95_05700 [Gemmatimonadales bacterium]|nr:hypothetical protein [Gemmatimonadales bacterium]
MVVLLLTAALSAIQAGDSLSPADSARIHRDMVAAQRRFESDRRRQLPLTTSGSGRCDVQVGRYCYWYDPSEPPPPEEPAAIKEDRGEFLAVLAEAADKIPGDPWILGQRIRYLVEHGAHDFAAAVARSCDGWWCRAVEGFALHNKGDVAGAEAAFAAALEEMPEADRCEWNDLSVVLEPEDEAYQNLDCIQRDSANALLFWRSRPLLRRPGNDVRTDWYSRQVIVRALEGAITHHGNRLTGDLREVLLRYGWATAYSRTPPRHGAIDDDVSVVGHEPRPAYPFLAVDRQERWPPTSDRPRARFSPVFARRIAPLENAQVARFIRGDSAVFVAGYGVPKDSLFQRATEAWLGLSAEPGRPPLLADVSRGAAVLRAPADGGMISLEVHDSTHDSWAVYRSRAEEAPGDISDLLLIRQSEELPGTLAESAERAWPGIQIPLGASAGLFWETYGHSPGDSLVDVNLTIERIRQGFISKLGQAVGLSRKVSPLRLAWRRERYDEVEFMAHAVEVDLSHLGPGWYLLTVEMSGNRRATRTLEIRRESRILAREPDTLPER